MDEEYVVSTTNVVYLYIHNIAKYFSAMKKYEIISFAGKWMELDISMLSKVSLSQKDKYHRFSLIGE
jgi:hypothetical protein